VVERDLRLVHRLEQARLRLGRRAVDLVGEHDVREHGPRLEHEVAAVGLVDAHADDVGRQHVGRELDALEAAADRARERGGERRLADAGDVLDQQMAAREEPDDREPDDLWLTDEGPGDVVLEPADRVERTAH
jgi:hypothetical protein